MSPSIIWIIKQHITHWNLSSTAKVPSEPIFTEISIIKGRLTWSHEYYFYWQINTHYYWVCRVDVLPGEAQSLEYSNINRNSNLITQVGTIQRNKNKAGRSLNWIKEGVWCERENNVIPLFITSPINCKTIHVEDIS